MISTEEKIKRIEQTESLNEVSLECLPPVQTDKYYFVSYSHKDYKLVYKDIFYLQQNGFSIWYDRGMEAGKNWKETAEKYITKYNCSGVIFFLSENSILSEAIHEEIKLLMENGKEFLTINLPFEGKYMSAKEMMNILIERGVRVDIEKQQFIEKYLNEDIIYIRADASYDEKIEKINSLKSSPLFRIDEFNPFDVTDSSEEEIITFVWPYHTEGGLYYLETTAVNDLDIKEVLIKDFFNSLKEGYSIEYFVRIGDSTFSNCRKLESVTLPKTTSVIGNYAFYNCEKLEEIDLSNIQLIKEHTFENCFKLRKIDLSSLNETKIISDYTFKNCVNLTELILPHSLNKIGIFAFENTKIKSFSLKYLHGDGICPYAFYNCKKLESFKVEEGGYFEIGKQSFYGCDLLKEFYLRDGLIKVNEKAFHNCKNLTYFPFNLVNGIGKNAFFGCAGLTTLEINGVNIDSEAFKDCVNIKKINFIEFTKHEIGVGTFYGLTNLESIYFAPKLDLINAYAFKNCISLTTIHIPSNISHIDESAFYNCKKLKEIYFSGTVDEWEELMHQDFVVPWFEETGEYVVICSDKTISKYEFMDK